ncbi:MAG: hypothetical protein ACYDEP_10455 [Acidimicrobiales bacterium]
MTYWRALILFVIGLISARFLPASVAGHLGNLPQIIGLARLLAFSLMLILWFRGDLSSLQKVVVIGLAVSDFIAGSSGAFALYDTAGVAIAAIIVMLILRPRLAVWLLVFAMPIVVVLNAAKTEARATEPTHVGPVSAAHALVTESINIALHPTPDVLTTSADRFSYADLLGYIEFHVPSTYPYWNKKSYTELPFAFIPRILDPYKPTFGLANEFGHRYGLISPTDFSTSVNTPLQVEAWANFGPEGLVGIAVVLGLLLGIGEGLISRITLDGLALGAVVAYQLAGGVESGILAWAFVIPVVIIFAPVARWALGVSSSLPPEDETPSTLPPHARSTEKASAS